MSDKDNDTSGYDYPVKLTLEQIENIRKHRIELCLQIIVWVLSLATLIYGVTSWCILTKFRNFKNFALLNAIFTNFLYSAVVRRIDELYFLPRDRFVHFHAKPPMLAILLHIYLRSVYIHWLLVLCHMFYVDIVKVFNGHIRRKYLKAFLFAWGAALITTATSWFLVFIFTETKMKITQDEMSLTVIFLKKASHILPLIANTCYYIIIVCSLCRSFNTSAHRPSDTCRRLYIATLIFILSDVSMLSIILADTGDPFAFTFRLIRMFLARLNVLVIDVFVVVVKSNRQIWYEFYVNKFKRSALSSSHRDYDIAIQEISHINSADSDPMVPVV